MQIRVIFKPPPFEICWVRPWLGPNPNPGLIQTCPGVCQATDLVSDFEPKSQTSDSELRLKMN